MITLRDVHKRFGTQVVLDGISLEVARGETVVIIGRSGSGKSVILKHMLGLLRPDSGAVTVDGQEVSKLDKRGVFALRRRFGVLFQSGALINWLSVYDNVALPLREHTKFSAEEVDRVVREKLALMDLSEHGHKMPSDISGGMKKRAGLARAIVLDPEILLYDEPTSGLDPVMASRINDLVKELKSRLRVTSVVVTHDMDSAYRVADRIAMLYNGRIVQVGGPEEIKGSSDPIVRQFVEGRIEGPIE